MRVRSIVFLSMLVFLQACGSNSVKESRPNVTSSPPGASIYANGLKLGVTPLKVDLFKVFPTSWSGWQLSATGVLAFRKAGCEEYTIKVNDAIISKPVHAKLKCDKHYVAPAAVPVHKPAVMMKAKKKKMTKIEKRLSELERLYKKGVITQDEYKATRKRILNEL